MKRKALGKGLSALLPDPDESPGAGTNLLEVPIELLEPNPYQPRTRLSPERLQELASSLRESGMIQPILVRRRGQGYQIIAGERRFKAAQSLGLPRVPVTISDVPDERLLELALVENIQREELTCMEEAQAFQRLRDELGWTQEEVAQKVGKDRTTITNTLRLLKLPREVRDLLGSGRLEAGHGRALLALEDPGAQLALAREAAEKRLSVREVERRVSQAKAPRPKHGKARDPNTRAAEERLRAALGTRVEIARKGKGGALKIAFTSESELNRLYETLLRAARGRA